MRKTYFIDIDGTLLEHIEDWENIHSYEELKALPGANEKTAKWHCEGHLIVLTTARPHSLKDITVAHLQKAGIFYDTLIMGIGAGERILINDHKLMKPFKARAENVITNVEGLSNID